MRDPTSGIVTGAMPDVSLRPPYTFTFKCMSMNMENGP